MDGLVGWVGWVSWMGCLTLRLDTLREYRVDLLWVREVHIHIVVGVTLVAIYTEESRGSALLEVLAHDLH